MTVPALAFLVGSSLVAIMGVAMLLWGLVVRRRHRRFMATAARAWGVVTHREPDHEGTEDEIITFTPTTGPAAGRSVSVPNRFDAAGLEVGARVEVIYDPADATRAFVTTGLTATKGPEAQRLFVGVGALLALLGAAMAVVLPPVLEADEAMMKAARDFVAVVRGGDREAIRHAALPGADLDEDYLLASVRPTQSMSFGSRAMGLDDGCVRAWLSPGKVVLVMKLVEQDGRWWVQSASKRDLECEERMED